MSGEAAYLAAVAVGVILAALAVRALPREGDSVPSALRARLRVAALVGGVAGAYLFELPADLLGWSAPASRGVLFVGGRTVLGGLLGGWALVELAKWRAGFVGATGDRFALPLAIGLASGRVGCVLRGCCEGVPIGDDHPLARLGALHGAPRFPAAMLEGWFHALAAIGLVLLAWRGRANGAHLAIYLTLYAVVRFTLELQRDHPAILLGATYYQWLSLALFVLAAGTWWRRTRGAQAGGGAEPA